MTNRLSLGALRVRPYDRTSAVADMRPGIHLFDDRNHFLLFHHTCGVAVCAWWINNLFFRRVPRGVRTGLLTIALEECGDHGRRLAEHRTRDFRMSRSEVVRPMRIDLPVVREQLSGDTRYRIVAEADGRLIASREIRFFAIDVLRKLPTRWYFPLRGWITASGKRYMSPGRRAGGEFKVHFRLEIQLKGVSALPELEISVTDARGKARRMLCTPRPHPDGKTVDIEAAFAAGSLSRGVCCARVHCMTYAFAGFLFSTDGSPVAGRWDKKELMRIGANTTVGPDAAVRLDAALRRSHGNGGAAADATE